MWEEYMRGIGGRKPAKDFTAKERGAVKYTYSLRKPFWNLVNRMIRAGYSSDAAIEKIYECYPRGWMTSKIIQQIRTDERAGGEQGEIPT